MRLEINHEVKNFCKKFRLTHIQLADEFAYYPENNLITYTIWKTDTDEELIKLVNKKYETDIAPLYMIFSLLHEIGHYMTIDNFNDEDLETDLFMRNMIQMMDEEKQGEMYINLPMEDAATSWALEFIKNNFELCSNFENKVAKIFNKGLTELKRNGIIYI